VLVLDQITDPHNVGAIMRSAAASRSRPSFTTARHSPEATGVLAKAASGALELVPLVTVQNLARRAHRVERPGLHDVGLDSHGSENLGNVALRSPWRWCSAPKQGVAAIDARDLQRGARLDLPAKSRASMSRTLRCWLSISAPAGSA